WMAQVIESYQKLSGNKGVPPKPLEKPEKPEETYGKHAPFLALMLANRHLNRAGSAKETRHIEFDLEDSGMIYQAGDVVGISPKNNPEYVETLLQGLGMDGYREVLLGGETLTLREALYSHLDITTLTRPLMEKYAELCGNEDLNKLLEDPQALSDYLWGRQILDLFEDFPTRLEPQAIVPLLRNMAPRLYSIASSPNAHPGQVHLTVGVVRFKTPRGRLAEGVCSNYLARTEPGYKVPLYIQANPHFRLPADPTAPIIMVGPGTGIAPFRAFVEEREISGASGKNWLFFGDQHRETDFLYEEEWLDKLERGVLTRLDLAFSRDQEQRVYVQQRMRENAADLYAWLEEGAYFYVCGDASRMAKDVHQALLEILIQEGKFSEDNAKAYLKTMEQSGRYQRDVY
ncbi:MAG TPA: assimilatory sulfite reductase (NADPH) flavoprotein subunit, partial [Rhizobiales bacterium]|nr:assimilatory sulfite reductase (NADPH) flavoprotein subunit [Hyphomicrobiales bacterium]